MVHRQKTYRRKPKEIKMRKSLIVILMITSLSVIANEVPLLNVGIGDTILKVGDTHVVLSSVIYGPHGSIDYTIRKNIGSGKTEIFKMKIKNILYLNINKGQYMIVTEKFDPDRGIATFQVIRYK
jgi:hypothetical protein